MLKMRKKVLLHLFVSMLVLVMLKIMLTCGQQWSTQGPGRWTLFP